jgi:hypothetical protein
MMDGLAGDVQGDAITLIADRPSSRRCANPELAIARERALLAVIALSPGLRACEIAPLLTEPAGATATRRQRLGDRGLIERIGHRWYAAGAAPDADASGLSEFEIIERARPPFDRTRWVQPISYYLVFNPSPFACRRYG